MKQICIDLNKLIVGKEILKNVNQVGAINLVSDNDFGGCKKILIGFNLIGITNLINFSNLSCYK